MANYTHNGAQRLSDATSRAYGALKRQLQSVGTPTRQHNVDVETSAPKKAVKKTASAKQPAKKAASTQTTSKSTAKKAAKKTASKKS